MANSLPKLSFNWFLYNANEIACLREIFFFWGGGGGGGETEREREETQRMSGVSYH